MEQIELNFTWLLTFKTLHLIGVVAWFAGLFYLVRIFVYHREAFDLPSPEKEILVRQYNLMEWRVYKIICNPAMMITFSFGFMMLAYNPSYLQGRWMHIKLLLVFLLLGYHIFCKSIIKKLEAGSKKYSSMNLRMLNEVPTLFLVFIVSLAVFRDRINPLYIFLSVIAFAAVLVLLTKMYKKIRTKKV